MKRLGAIFALVALGFGALALFAPVAATQPSGWLSFLLQDPQGVVQFRALGAYGAPGFIAQGTAAPTLANSGSPPVHGEVSVVRDNAGANEPVLQIYSMAGTAQRSYIPSTLVTNAVDVANSIWGVSNGLHFEGATADASESSIQSDDPTADQVFDLPDNAVADNYNLMFSVLDTNALEVANSMWFESNALVMEGATANAFEHELRAEDPTVGIQISLMPDRAVADTFYMYNIADGELTSGYLSIPPLFSSTDDALVDFTAGNNAMYVHRYYVSRPITISDVAVLLVDGGAIAGADIVGVAIYEDADAGVQLTEGTGDGTAAGLEEIALTDVTLFPGYYRIAVCSSDATNLHLAGASFDDEQIDVVSAVAGDIAYGTAANPCVAGDPPATTGALTTADENIPFLYFY